jgi:hypothetical protein
MLLECGNLKSKTVVSFSEASIREFNIIILLASDCDLVFSGTNLSLEIEDNSLKFLSTKKLCISLSQKSDFLIVTSIEISLRN